MYVRYHTTEIVKNDVHVDPDHCHNNLFLRITLFSKGCLLAALCINIPSCKFRTDKKSLSWPLNLSTQNLAWALMEVGIVVAYIRSTYCKCSAAAMPEYSGFRRSDHVTLDQSMLKFP